jgi:hypothetical protein
VAPFLVASVYTVDIRRPSKSSVPTFLVLN